MASASAAAASAAAAPAESSEFGLYVLNYKRKYPAPTSYAMDLAVLACVRLARLATRFNPNFRELVRPDPVYVTRKKDLERLMGGPLSLSLAAFSTTLDRFYAKELLERVTQCDTSAERGVHYFNAEDINAMWSKNGSHDESAMADGDDWMHPEDNLYIRKNNDDYNDKSVVQHINSINALWKHNPDSHLSSFRSRLVADEQTERLEIYLVEELEDAHRSRSIKRKADHEVVKEITSDSSSEDEDSNNCSNAKYMHVSKKQATKKASSAAAASSAAVKAENDDSIGWKMTSEKHMKEAELWEKIASYATKNAKINRNISYCIATNAVPAASLAVAAELVGCRPDAISDAISSGLEDVFRAASRVIRENTLM
jgi:hypothetical protein